MVRPSPSPRLSLARVLADLGPTVLELACPAGDLDAEVTSVVIHDRWTSWWCRAAGSCWTWG
ncbi:hypothetical protein [Streptoalloteichus hindustanus]|uniref:hypothetical protein n=1 Tax=Streptoalloteichus hindustanus TaxID=2017 RepID=UPI000936F82D|nr:hypothetical protein [Streptoalloteichus hindustanus]